MKIVFETHGLDRFGGAERRLLRIHEQLAATYEIHLLVHGCSQEEFELGARRCGMGFDWVASTSYLQGSIPSQAANAIAYLKRIRPAVVHCFDASRFNCFLSLLSQGIRGKLLLTMAYCLYGDGIPGDMDNRLEFLLSRVDWLDLLFPWQKDRYAALLKDSVPISLTPSSFTDLDSVRPGRKEKLIVMFAARLEEFKGVDLLIEACGICADKLQSNGYTVAICGAGDRFEPLRNRINSYGIGDVVRLMGYQDPRDWFSRAAVACNISPKASNYPSQTLIEAAASGCYCIVSNTPHSDLMVDLEFSVLVDPAPMAVADALVGYIDKSQCERDAIIRSAREFAESHFSIDSSVSYFKNIILRLCS